MWRGVVFLCGAAVLCSVVDLGNRVNNRKDCGEYFNSMYQVNKIMIIISSPDHCVSVLKGIIIKQQKGPYLNVPCLLSALYIFI